ncbi:hypothetical protein QFC19_004948 [Naganishia cerealis]|uniref:Uncharacterized protein n=1 Tax=Naganishia cerealis TaxID=610337 RepID=A0ACC2VRQ9_9TREE|nr:hypothetical protein QFC19_004948 [Naganishia cerealis]
MKENLESRADVVQEETMASPSTTYRIPGPHGVSRSTILSAMLLSLLPLPATAYPQPRNKGSRRDRKRSGDFTSARGGKEHELGEGVRNARIYDEGRGRREYHPLRYGEDKWDEDGIENGDMEYVVERSDRQVQTSEQTSDPLPTMTLHRRVDVTTAPSPTATSTAFPIPVPVTALPYKLTQESDGIWTTVDGGWTLYGRASIQPTHQALADTDNSANKTYDITAALPTGWGRDSVRGNLYAVPLIVVASVCLALLFIVFIIVVVISRAKVKRKAQRRKRREASREKKERRERRLAARAAAATTATSGGEPNVPDGERRPSSLVSGTTNSTGRRSRRPFDSASSMTDSEDEQDESPTPRESASSSTLRKAKQAAAAAAVDSTLAQQTHAVARPTTRAGKAKKRFGWTSAVHAGAANAAVSGGSHGVSTARLGDPKRIWGWKKGLRRRGKGGALDGEPQSRAVTTDLAADVGGLNEVEEAETTAVELARSPTGESRSSAPAGSPVNVGVESNVGISARQPAESTINGETVERAPSSAVAEPIGDQPSQPSLVSAFPPAYYQASSPSAQGTGPAPLGPSAAATESSSNGRMTDVGGPSARVLEKRAMLAEPEYVDYFPAPTTEEQEQAVDIAYNRNVGLAQFSSGGDTSSGGAGSTLPPLAGQSGGMQVVPAGSGGHVATDDKQLLERLRLAGSAPPPLVNGAEFGAAVQHSPGGPTDAHRYVASASTANHLNPNGQQQMVALHASAPELPVDEDGFERLDDDLPPPDETVVGHSSSINGLPLPPAPIAQYSLAYAQPSAPLGMHSFPPTTTMMASSAPSLSAPAVPTAPSAPFEMPEEEGDATTRTTADVAVPSAPPLLEDIDDEDADGDSDMVIPLEPSAATLAPEGDESSVLVNQVVTPAAAAVAVARSATLPRRFTIPHRTLGIDLPSELAATATITAAPPAAPPAFSHPEQPPVSGQGNDGNGSAGNSVVHVRYLPRYEP